MLANTKISVKIYGLVAILLLLMAASSSVGIYQMAKIGSEIVDIAEVDIPMTQKITKITVHQLEQAILFERGLAVGMGLTSNPDGLKHFHEIENEFVELGHKITEEMHEAEKVLAEEIKVAHTPEIKAEFEHLLSILTKTDAEHEIYEQLSVQAFNVLGRGELLHPGNAEKIEHQEDQIVKELEAALEEIGKFTAEAMLTAEHDEELGIMLLSSISVVSLLLGCVFAFFLVRSITKPVLDMTDAMGVLSSGDMTIEIPGADRGDEVGTMAAAVQVFKENMIKNDEMAEREKVENETRIKRAEVIDGLLKNFNKEVSEALEIVSSASTELESSSQTMSSTAEQTSQQASAVAAAAEQASANVSTVASAAEELGASGNEISRQISESESISQSAREEGSKANEMIQGLSQTVNKIGDVVSLISDIAEQTNLLALNATIEAARAGDAGKGFAVVASEVKNLANQTAKATEEITGQVTEIQNVTEKSVDAIGNVSKVIEQMSAISSGISAAIEEQGSAVREISVNVQEASSGTSEVTENISGVSQAASETGSAANEVFKAAKTVAERSNTLRTQVDTFLSQISVA